MNKGLSIALIIVGVLLLVWGIDASNSTSSEISQHLSGTPTNKTMWLLSLGIISGLLGFSGLFFGRRSIP